MSTSVQVAVRVRPMLEKEKVDNSVCIIPYEHRDKHRFTFDYVFGPLTTQQQFYDKCVKSLIESCFSGYNVTIFAYGQTNSGKTYTMGTDSSTFVNESMNGILPRAFTQIYDIINKTSNSKDEYSIRATFIEIYGEELRDLLDPDSNNNKDILIRETETGELIIAGCKEEEINCQADLLSCLSRGSINRITASTCMNSNSSRSHALFSVYIERYIKDENSTAAGTTPTANSDSNNSNPTATTPTSTITGETRTSKLNFVDLAGSERVGRTLATGDRFREGVNINKGLLCLGNVISILADPTKKGNHVPYRDSKLTRILQDSLGGNAKTLMITCVSPSDDCFNESLNALRYANRARNIQNKPVVNRDETSSKIAELQREIFLLKSQRIASSHSASSDVRDLKAKLETSEMEIQRLNKIIKENKVTIKELSNENISLKAQFDFYMNKYNINEDGEEKKKDNEKIVVISEYIKEIERLKKELDEKEKKNALLLEDLQNSTNLYVEEKVHSMGEKARHCRIESDALLKLNLTLSAQDLEEENGHKDKEKDDNSSNNSSLNNSIELPSPIKIPEINNIKDNKTILFGSTPVGANSKIRRPTDLSSSVDTRILSEDRNSSNNGNNSNDVISRSNRSHSTSLSQSERQLPSQTKTVDEIEGEIQHAIEENEKIISTRIELTDGTIKMKEETLSHLMDKLKEYKDITEHYKMQLTGLEKDMSQLEEEKKKLQQQLDATESDKVETEKLRSDLTKQLKTKDDQLKKLKAKKTQYNTYVSINSATENKITRLQIEIQDLKAKKVQYAKSIDDMRKRYSKEMEEKKKETKKYQKESERLTAIIKKLKQNDKEKEALLHKKIEDIKKKDEQMKKLEEKIKILTTQPKPKAGEEEKYSYEWVVEQIDSGAEIIQKIYAIDKEIQRKSDLLQRYKRLCNRRAQYNTNPVEALNSEDGNFNSMEDLDEEIDSIEAELNYKESKIVEIEDSVISDDNDFTHVIDNIKTNECFHNLSLNLYQYAIELKDKTKSLADLVAQKDSINQDTYMQLESLRNQYAMMRDGYEKKIATLQRDYECDLIDWGPLTGLVSKNNESNNSNNNSPNKPPLITTNNNSNNSNNNNPKMTHYSLLQEKIRALQSLNQKFAKEKENTLNENVILKDDINRKNNLIEKLFKELKVLSPKKAMELKQSPGSPYTYFSSTPKHSRLSSGSSNNVSPTNPSNSGRLRRTSSASLSDIEVKQIKNKVKRNHICTPPPTKPENANNVFERLNVNLTESSRQRSLDNVDRLNINKNPTPVFK